MGWRSMGRETEWKNSMFVLERAVTDRPEYAGESAVLVSVCSYKDGVPEGAFLSFDNNQRYEFRGLDQMLLKMEDIMDGLSVPCPAVEHRSFYGKPYLFQKTEPGQRMSRERCRPEDMPRLPRGKASFVLRIYYRQHESMQGEMAAAVTDDKDGKREKRAPFRSALELMRMIHEYLESIVSPEM